MCHDTAIVCINESQLIIVTDGFLASLRAQTREYVGASISGNSYKGRIYGERADDKGGEGRREEM